jgi:hypothetical protein
VSQVFSLEIDNTGNVYVAAKTDDMGTLVSDSLYLRVVKFTPNGDMSWSDIDHNVIKAYYMGVMIGINNANNTVVLMANNEYLYIDGMWQGSIFSGVSKLDVIEFDKNTLQKTAQYEWISDHSNGYYVPRATNNVPTAIVADSYGNYIVGGAVGTRFYLNDNDSSAMIWNYGAYDSDFWLGKFGNKDCTGQAVDNPADTLPVAVPAVKVVEMSIYPNPASNELYLNLPNAAQEAAVRTVAIFNIAGQQIINEQWQQNRPLNISSLPAGVYIIKCGDYRGRFVKN